MTFFFITLNEYYNDSNSEVVYLTESQDVMNPFDTTDIFTPPENIRKPEDCSGDIEKD